jgi:hypothetical protein
MKIFLENRLYSIGERGSKYVDAHNCRLQLVNTWGFNILFGEDHGGIGFHIYRLDSTGGRYHADIDTENGVLIVRGVDDD